MALSTDPYEQKLYSLFQEHDVHARGKLGREALLKLCKTLELAKPAELLKRLLRDGSTGQVSFGEFREGLLFILSGEEEPEQPASATAVKHQDSLRAVVPGQKDSSEDGQNNVSSASPTVASPTSAVSNTSTAVVGSSQQATTPGSSIMSSNTSKQPQFTYRRENDPSTVVGEIDSVVKIIDCSSHRSSRLVPSGESEEDDLVQTTIGPVTPTTTLYDDNENESSDREVSPKFVVGTKKYGRRSRPREDCNGLDTSSDFSNSDNESVPQQQTVTPCSAPSDNSASSKNSSSKVQRSASQSDIHGSKRRRPMSGSRLKRCASLPTHRQRPDLAKLNAKNVRDKLNMDEKIDKKIYFMKLSENLRDIWDSLVGSGHGDLLNQSQLEVVCERVGLQKLPAKLAAREVFAKLSLQSIEGISYDDFIALLQSDSDILAIGGGGVGEKEPVVTSGAGDSGVRVRLFDESDTFKVQELDRDSVEETVGFTVRMPAEWTTEIGSLSTAIIIDMWESAGISEPRSLLQDLGFYGAEVQVTELIAALEDEQQRLGDGNDTSVVVRASLALHKAEVSALRQAFLQLMEENKKLYSDNKEANQRAQLLLQEVDERHNSLENATRNKIRLLEQRHHETVKELTSQLAFEREQLSCANAALEKRIQGLEQDEGKMKAEVNRLLEENEGLRAEQENLTKELTDILEKNIKLNRDIAELEENNRNDFDDEYAGKNDLEVLELIEKNSLLQDKNKELKDKNDELSVEIEMLNVELAKFKLKRSGVSRTNSLDVSPTVLVESSGLGEENTRKRQGDSPSKARLSDESPRLGKFRKCSNDVENESDSSGDWMALHSELGLKVDGAIASSGISVDSGSKVEEIQQLKAKIAELEKRLDDKKGEEVTEGEKCESDNLSEVTGETQSDQIKLKARCDELEASLEQLGKEYEACEDYWQAKLNEERLLYEEEQRVADDKFNELLKKMAEYEEQFAGQAGQKNSEDGRLSPIEEKDVLEQQYLDLEVEFQQSQSMLQDKTLELDKLRGRILELEQLTKYPSEALLATPPRVDTPEMESPASTPMIHLWNQSTIQAPATRDYQNPNWCQPLKVSSVPLEMSRASDDGSAASSKLNTSLSSLPSKVAQELRVDDADDTGFDRTISPIQKPISKGMMATSTPCVATAESHELVDCSDVCSVKSARSTHSLASTHSIHKSVSQTDVASINQEQLKLLELQDEIKELTHQRDCLKMEFQQLNEVKPILARSLGNNKPANSNLTQKVQHLEQKNRQLQAMLKQQQNQSEQILERIWMQHRSENAELRNQLDTQNMIIADQANRLANNDQLVRELYVENGRLISQVQRLEQQKARATMLQQLQQAGSAATTGHCQLSGIVPGLP
ncbi:blastoderm-specific protein 25D isoform X1 [Aedes albopictus]|uniref:Uncharacterized protein n=1 Tax=Aedes albopictus TaxID=7160 RepID=A0ABM1Y6H2_AEDAL